MVVNELRNIVQERVGVGKYARYLPVTQEVASSNLVRIAFRPSPLSSGGFFYGFYLF